MEFNHFEHYSPVSAEILALKKDVQTLANQLNEAVAKYNRAQEQLLFENRNSMRKSEKIATLANRLNNFEQQHKDKMLQMYNQFEKARLDAHNEMKLQSAANARRTQELQQENERLSKALDELKSQKNGSRLSRDAVNNESYAIQHKQLQKKSQSGVLGRIENLEGRRKSRRESLVDQNRLIQPAKVAVDTIDKLLDTVIGSVKEDFMQIEGDKENHLYPADFESMHLRPLCMRASYFRC